MNKNIKSYIAAIIIVVIIALYYVITYNISIRNKTYNGVCPSCGYSYQSTSVFDEFNNNNVCPYCGNKIDIY